MFNTSIRENLLLARRDAGRSEILHALAMVELAEWAACLPQGLDTIVGRDGELLSGGQRRRLALARALLSRRAVPDPRRADRASGPGARAEAC